ncbi:CCDC92/74 N-terminal domain-containing protein [Camponotus japonicus]
MTSKVLMKLPTVPFPQGKKAPPDLVSLNERNDGFAHVRHQSLNIDRVVQLEQNMKFLQEQHQATLVALHQEIESLRQRNRDLQFQLVFSKRAHCNAASSPSSPEDNGNGFAKSKNSPICVNVTPLQVELLEKDLQDIKASLHEAKTHNQYLSSIIEQQKKKLDKDQKNKIETTDVGVQVGDPVQASLVVLLEESYAMVKRLHKENMDQKKEIASLRAASANNASSSRGGRSRDGNNSHHSRVSPTSTTMQEQNSRKFPPLPIPSYWHRRSSRYNANRHEKQDHQADTGDSTVLPQLQNGSVRSAEATNCFESPSYRSREYRNYGRDGNNRKFRGQASRRESNHYYHSRDFKDRNSKDYPRDADDTGEGSKDGDNPRRQ